MASVVWMAVFFLLMFELVITAILVLPLPRFLRRFIARKIFTYDLGRRVRFISNFIILGLILAVSDAIQTLRHLETKVEEESRPGVNDGRVGYIAVSFDKQRKFRAERNMYLAGFALTLMFCIARIVELMQQTVNAEEDCEQLKRRVATASARAVEAESPAAPAEEESHVTTDAPSPSAGAPGSTPYTLRRRAVSNGGGDKDD